MKKLLLELGLDLSDWKSKLHKAKKEFRVLTRGIERGLSTAIKGGITIGASAFTIWATSNFVIDHIRSFERLGDTVKAASQEMKLLTEDVYQLNAELGLKSATKTADLMRMVSKMSKITSTDLKQLTYQTGLLEKKYGDQQGQLKAQIAMMRDLKATTIEAGDAVAYLNSKGGDLKGELLESISEYAVQFAEAGFDLNQTIAILESGLGKSWNVDKAADTFKEARLRLMGGDKEVVDALDMLGLSDLDEQIKAGTTGIPKAMAIIQTELSKLNNASRFRIAKDIFGTQYEDIGGAAMTAMLQGMKKEIYTTGSIDQIAVSLQSRISFKWDQSISKTNNSISRMIDTMKPVLVPFIEFFGKSSELISDFSKKYEFITKTIGAGIGVFLFGGLALGALALGFGVLSAGLAVLTSPITLIIAGLAGLTYGLYLLEERTGLLSKAWQSFREVFVTAWQVVKPHVETIKNLATQAWDQIGELGIAIADLIPGFDDLGKSLDLKTVGTLFGEVIELFVINQRNW